MDVALIDAAADTDCVVLPLDVNGGLPASVDVPEGESVLVEAAVKVWLAETETVRDIVNVPVPLLVWYGEGEIVELAVEKVDTEIEKVGVLDIVIENAGDAVRLTVPSSDEEGIDVPVFVGREEGERVVEAVVEGQDDEDGVIDGAAVSGMTRIVLRSSKKIISPWLDEIAKIMGLL